MVKILKSQPIWKKCKTLKQKLIDMNISMFILKNIVEYWVDFPEFSEQRIDFSGKPYPDPKSVPSETYEVKTLDQTTLFLECLANFLEFSGQEIHFYRKSCPDLKPVPSKTY